MFIPIGDSPNPVMRPVMTYGLIGLNIGVFLWLLPSTRAHPALNDPRLVNYLQAIASDRELSLDALRSVAGSLTLYDLFVFEHGFRPAAASLTDAFSAMFLHAGWLHLAGNMLFLWIFGDNVEHRLGRLAFLGFYLAAGLAATGGDALLRPGSEVPTVGASGAISGVLGAYFIWFPANRVRVWVFLFPIFMRVIEIGARWVLGFYLIVDNVLPVLLARVDGVSRGAHIGGFAAGAALAVVTAAFGLGRLGSDDGDGRALIDALADGSHRRVARLWLGSRDRDAIRRLDLAEALALAEALEEAGDDALALAVFSRAAREFAGGPLQARAWIGAARQLLAAGRPTEAWPPLAAALDSHLTPSERREAERLLVILQARTSRLPRVLPNDA